MKIFIFELKRAMKSREMKIALLIGVVLVIGQAIGFYTINLHDMALNEELKLDNGEYEVGEFRNTLYQAFLGGESVTFFNGVYFSLWPLLVAFPFAGSLFKDRESGYMKQLCSHVDRSIYHCAKYAAVFLSGGLAGGFPYLASFLVSALIYPADYPNCLANRDGILDGSLFADYYFLHPLVYTLLFLLVIVLFGGVLATFSLLFSFWAKNILVVWFVPFMLYTAQDLLMQKMSLARWSVASIINSQSMSKELTDLTVVQMAGLFLLLLIITLGGFLIVGRKKEMIV